MNARDLVVVFVWKLGAYVRRVSQVASYFHIHEAAFAGVSSDQNCMVCRHTDSDSGLGRSTPPRRAASPGIGSMRHLTSPSGPGSLPPALMTSKKRVYDDGSSDISSTPSSMMDYNGEWLISVNVSSVSDQSLSRSTYSESMQLAFISVSSFHQLFVGYVFDLLHVQNIDYCFRNLWDAAILYSTHWWLSLAVSGLSNVTNVSFPERESSRRSVRVLILKLRISSRWGGEPGLIEHLFRRPTIVQTADS